MTQIFLAAQAAQGGGSMTSFIIMMVAIFAIMYFFMIKPQQKRQKEIQNFQKLSSALTKALSSRTLPAPLCRTSKQPAVK